MKRLEGFHTRCAYRMAVKNKRRRNRDGTWELPSSEDVWEEVGLHTIDHYVWVRRNTAAEYIATRPIFE